MCNFWGLAFFFFTQYNYLEINGELFKSDLQSPMPFLPAAHSCFGQKGRNEHWVRSNPPPPPPISPPSSAKQALGSLSASETPRSRISFCDQHADLLVGNSVFLFKGTVQLHGRLVHVQSPFQLSPSFILPLSFLCNFFFPD